MKFEAKLEEADIKAAVVEYLKTQGIAAESVRLSHTGSGQQRDEVMYSATATCEMGKR